MNIIISIIIIFVCQIGLQLMHSWFQMLHLIAWVYSRVGCSPLAASVLKPQIADDVQTAGKPESFTENQPR